MLRAETLRRRHRHSPADGSEPVNLKHAGRVTLATSVLGASGYQQSKTRLCLPFRQQPRGGNLPDITDQHQDLERHRTRVWTCHKPHLESPTAPLPSRVPTFQGHPARDPRAQPQRRAESRLLPRFPRASGPFLYVQRGPTRSPERQRTATDAPIPRKSVEQRGRGTAGACDHVSPQRRRSGTSRR